MPTIVQTVTGKVTGIWGTAKIRDAQRGERELHLGDTVNRGDVVLTSPDGIVQLTPERDGAAAPAALLVPPVDAGEVDRVIAGLDQPLADDAPAAGLAGGGEGDLQPGLRVDRVVESVTPAGVSSSGVERANVVAPDGGAAASREAVNQTPSADAASRSVAEDTPAAVALTGRDADGSIRAVTVTTLPAHGTLALADGTAVAAGEALTPQQAATLRFTPEAGFHGATAIAYTVTDNDGATSAPAEFAITVTPVNDAPAAAPATLTTAEDTPLAVTLAGSDADGNIAAVTVTRLPEHGTLLLADGSTPVTAGSALAPADAARLVFVPAADFYGDSAIVFTVTDDAGAVSPAARVAIGITAVNDAPAVRNDAAATDEDTPLVLTPAALLGNDSDADGDPLTIVGVQNAVGGSVALVNGNVVFTPAADFNGSASFSYTASDGHGGSGSATVSVNVAPVADPAVSIGDVTVDERAGVATFFVSLSEPTTATVSVGFGTVDGSASSGSPADYSAVGGTLTFAPGVTSQTISVPIGDDRVFEGRETFVVELRGPVNATLGRATATGTITDDGSGPPGGGAGQPADDDRPVLSVSGGSVVEGDFAVFSVALSNPSTQPVVFTPALVSGSAGVGTDTAPADALEWSSDGGANWSPVSGDVTVAPHATSVLLRLPTTADGLNEGSETFSLSVTPVDGAAAAPASGVATLIDRDGAPSLSIDDVNVDEAAGTATFTVSLSSASGLPVSVGFATADLNGAADGATADSDYAAVAGTLAFAPGVTRQTITVPIVDDAVLEGAERFHVVLSAPVNAALAVDTGTATLHDDGSGPGPAPGVPPDDDTPAVGSVSSPSVVEGGALDFVVGLTHTSTTPTAVLLNAVSGSASVGTDTVASLQVSFDGGQTFAAVGGDTVSVPAGVGSFIVRLPTVDDASTEPTEQLALQASTPANALPLGGTGSILDNDGTPALAISGPAVIDEAAGTATYTVTLSHPSSSAVSVAYATVDGSALAGQDYTAASGTLEFAPNELSKTITVAITDDAVFEGSESFSLVLTAPLGATLAGAGALASAIVDDGRGGPGADDDTPAVGSVSDPSVVEGGNLDFEVALTHAASTPTRVTLTAASGSATLGVDTDTDTHTHTDTDTDTVGNTAAPLLVSFDGGRTFVPVDGPTVEVPAGAAGFLVRVPTTDDALSEATESLTLAAATPANAAPVVGTGSIVDNDGTPRLGISGPAVVDEAAGSVTYTVTLSHPSASTVTVAYGTVDGSAVAGQDFTAAAGLLSFAPNELTKTVTVAITDDAVFEGPESFSLRLSAPAGATLGSGAAAEATTTIRDDGSAPGATPDKTAADDDTPRVGTVSSPSVTEGGDLDFTVALTHTSTMPTAVAVSLASGSASVGADTAGPLQVSFDGGYSFAPLNGPTVLVPAGVGSFVVRAATVDDAISEPTESLTLAASTPTDPANHAAAAVVGSGTIVDNDGTPVVSISGPAVVDEAAGTVTYTVTLSNPSASAVSVAYATADGSAVAGQDFAAAAGRLTFAPNQVTKTITVAITDDAVFEGPESFSLHLSAPSGAALAAGHGATVTTTIRDDGNGPAPQPGAAPDDDTPRVGTVSSPTVVEGGTLDFVVGLTHVSTTPTVVSLAVASGSATLGVDTGGGPLQVSFDGGQTFTALAGGPAVQVPAGVGSFTVRLATLDDVVSESPETLSLAAATPANAAPVFGTGTIVDNDGTPALTISGPAVVDEAAGTATYTVTLSNPSATAVSVGYGTVDGTAVAGQDYTAATGTLTFAPNEVTKTISVAITNDSVFEGGETFSLALNTPTGATIAAGSVVSTIKDDGTAPGGHPDNDTPKLSITGPAVVDEAAGTATYTVTLSNPSAIAVTVGYRTVDGTAVAGQDYTAATGTLTFAPNEVTKTISVAINNDNVFEGNETFSLALNTPTGAAIATIAAGTVVSTIKDDGTAPGSHPDNDTPKLSITGAAVVDEAAGTATYTVTLSNPSASAVTVGYRTVDGTAVAGQDYTAATGRLTFAPNELTKTITVAISNDNVYEGSETFSVALNTPTGATIANGSVVSAIRDDASAPSATPDDDRPAVGSVSSPTVTEGGNLDFAVHLTHPSATPTTVALTPASGSAVLGSDTSPGLQVSFDGGSTFSAVSGGSVAVPVGVTDFIVRAATVDDRAIEPTETITLTVSTPANPAAAVVVATGSIVDNEQTFFADAASGLRGEYYGYNETRAAAAGARTHSDDGTATFGNHNAAGNLNSVEDMYTIIDGRNALGGGSASLVGSAASAAKNVADVVFSARSIDYGFNPLVSSALGSNSNVAAGSALPAGDGAANSTTRSLENFLDQDRPTAVAQVGAGNTNGTSGLGLTTDAAMRIAGQLYVQPGSYDFRVTADDGFRLNVAGQTLLEYDGNQGPTTRLFNHVQLGDAGGGLQAMELLYWEQGGDARLRIEYKPSNEANGAYRLLDVNNTAMFSSENAPVFSNPLIQDLVRDDAAGGWRVRTGVALDGGTGNDSLTGTDGRDLLNGGAGNDTLNGGAGADTLNGGAGNDALNGGAGNDRLTGGAGADVLTGGTGDDTYVLSDRLDSLVENAGEGYDTVVLDAGYVAANAGSTYTLGANLENLTAEGSAAIDLTGNAADNRLEGNAAANTLDGGAGADRLIGGGGNDRLTGGAGHDVFEWRLADAGTPGAPAVDTITDFTYGGGYSNVQPTSGGDVLDLRDLLQGEHTSSGVTGNAAGAIEISNLLNYIDVQVSGADTVLHISKNGGFTGGSFSAGAEDQTIVLQNVNLYSATGVAAGDESNLLKTLIRNGTMVVD